MVLSKLILSVNLFLVVLFTQNNKTKYDIPWSEDVKLKWENFKAKPPKYTYNESAVTSSGVSSSVSANDTIIQFTVKCLFNEKESWVIRKDTSVWLLNHEQRHFDITEVYARKFRKIILKYHFKNIKEVGNMFNKTYRDINKEMNAEQKKYDRETDHSRNADIQNEWNQQIDKQLKALEQYKETTIVIKLRKQ